MRKIDFPKYICDHAMYFNVVIMEAQKIEFIRNKLFHNPLKVLLVWENCTKKTNFKLFVTQQQRLRLKQLQQGKRDLKLRRLIRKLSVDLNCRSGAEWGRGWKLDSRKRDNFLL